MMRMLWTKLWPACTYADCIITTSISAVTVVCSCTWRLLIPMVSVVCTRYTSGTSLLLLMNYSQHLVLVIVPKLETNLVTS